MLNDMVMFVAALLAGTGGALLGARGADTLNRLLGRAAPSVDEQA